MEIRLQKFLSGVGLASRRSAEKLILAGEIKVNGRVVSKLGTKVDPKRDFVSYQNKKLKEKKNSFLLYIFYKPKNCITSLKDEKDRITIAQYLPKTTPPLFPIGRLDYHSEGLLLVTNNGEWAQKIGHPKYKVKKTYLVKINGVLEESQWKKINKPMMIAGKIHRAKFKEIYNAKEKSWLQVELFQGFNLQIKKMLLMVGARVLKLKRIEIGTVALQDLKAGQYKLLTHSQIQSLLTPKISQQKYTKKPSPKESA
jgi:pseudouridine synthase